MVDQPSLFYWRGPQCGELLAEFRRHYPLNHVFPCSSGSAAIHIALAALRLKPGEEVIVPPITDMGSVIGILYQQAVPVFADVEPATGNLDVGAVRAAISAKTRAIVAVHLAGNPCDSTALRALARERGIALIEDCAQAWGALHQGRPVGLVGDFACYSFNEFKHVSCGDGGIVATDAEEYGPSLGQWGDKSYDRAGGERDAALLRDPAELAPNYRMSEPQAAVAAAQLTKLGEIVQARVQLGARLHAHVSAVPGLVPPAIRPGDTSSYWFFLLRVDAERFRGGRDEFAAALRAEGAPASAGYIPKPVYGYRVFQNHNFFGGAWPVRDAGLTTMDYRAVHCPIAEALLGDCLTLTINEAMTAGYIDKVGRAVAAVAARLRR
ncbi:MAG: DegT/DnrJ/EryC1/StrS family aminotransferase [Verrucomicrobia bacterium]|nr:DegT/DnrJ/EryC1/StrS family aminotransferase [Verrucomicrobiota bacterium]